jgi:hypothetical protein
LLYAIRLFKVAVYDDSHSSNDDDDASRIFTHIYTNYIIAGMLSPNIAAGKTGQIGEQSIVKPAVAGAAVVSITSPSITDSFSIQPITVRKKQKLKCHKKDGGERLWI